MKAKYNHPKSVLAWLTRDIKMIWNSKLRDLKKVRFNFLICIGPEKNTTYDKIKTSIEGAEMFNQKAIVVSSN